MTSRRGRLRVYLGMAPGVGKTYAMLEEAHRRRSRGADVVIGFVETYGRAATDAMLDGLEQVPRTHVVHRGVTIEEMDALAVIRRAPAVALIDELAHTNAPGSERPKRWEDIETIRAAGIDVISTCNVQHLESVADAVQAMTGAPVHERVPDEVMRGADEIELVDLSPAHLRERMRRGEIYPPDRTTVALERFFTEANLTALRDLSLRFVAGRVDADLQDRLTAAGEAGASSPGPRVMAVVDGDASPRVFQRAILLAARLRAPLLVLVLDPTPPRGIDPAGRRVEETVAEATAAGAEVLRVATDDAVGAIAGVVRQRGVTHVALAQPRRGRFARITGDSVSDGLMRLVPDLEISLVGPGQRGPEAHRATF